MALLKDPNPLPPGFPDDVTGWHVKPQAARGQASRTTRVHRPRSHIPNPDQVAAFGCAQLQSTRYWQGRISKWWKAHTWPGGYALFNALAAANPITNYWGKLKTVNGHQWFTRYQQLSLRPDWVAVHCPETNPQWWTAPPPFTPHDFPAYPLASYPGDPPIVISGVYGVSPDQIIMPFVNTGNPQYTSLIVLYSPLAHGPNARVHPAHYFLEAEGIDPTLVPGGHFQPATTHITPPAHPGQISWLTWCWFDNTSWMPGPFHATNFTWT